MSLTYVARPASNAQAPTLVVMHGYGADEYDLLPIASGLRQEFNIVSLEAPLALPFGGFAWYHLEQTPQGLKADDESRKASEQLILSSLAEILDKEGFSRSAVHLMGFSQGAAMSYSLLGSHDLSTISITLKSVTAMSGYIPRDILPEIKAKKLAGFPVMITHGSYDDLIPSIALDEARDVLTQCGAVVEAKLYPIGHGVTEETIEDISNWFDTTIAATAANLTNGAL